MKRTFNYHQYVPVLRWKSSEREALCKLDSNLRKRITPIIELVPQDFEKGSTDSVLTKHASQIAKSWGWNDLFFIDFHLLGENLSLIHIYWQALFRKEQAACQALDEIQLGEAHRH